MTPDLLSAFLRGLSFVALAQAAGGMIFLLMFGAVLGPSRHRIERTARVSALAALVLLPAQFALEAARMAGNLAGVLDPVLQAFALSTSLAPVLAARMIGVVLLLLALKGSRTATRLAGATAVLLLTGSFALTGHTAADAQRWLLAPLLVLHVIFVSFWFGALRPLMHVTACEPASVSAQVVARFSRIAGWMVPGILLAGLVLAALLLPDIQALGTPYGLTLVAKVGIFAALMGLAAFNRWRLGPALVSGSPRARRNFRLTVAAEWSLIAFVLMGTAMLTTFWSPD